MAGASSSWIDSSALAWSPERPFRAEAHRAEPFFRGDPRLAEPELVLHDTDVVRPANRSPLYLFERLVVGGLQGAGLVMLADGHGDPTFTAMESMLLLFMPLIILAGLGRVTSGLLLLWTLIASAGLAALGAYAFWRGGGIETALVLAAIFLFIGQALVTGWAREGEPLAGYGLYRDSAWNLATLVLLGAGFAVAACVGGGAAANYLRQNHPGTHLLIPVAPVVTVGVALISVILSPRLLRPLAWLLATFLILLLPLASIAAAAAALAGMLGRWQPPLMLDLCLAVLLLLGINASYGAGQERPHWREIMELAGAFALMPVVLLGAAALRLRVLEWGWTAPRILAVAALTLLGLYALLYLLAGLIGLGGGGWMKRIERANLGMALVVMAVAAALASPFADPGQLAVENQVQRLQAGQASVETFDFAYLKNGGARFGRQALDDMMARKDAPALSRAAFLAASSPKPDLPMPTEMGANIHVRSPGGRLPAALLERDWSGVPGVPPCLTSTVLACDAYFLDLDGDGQDEIILSYGDEGAWWAVVMKQDAQGWNPVGNLASSCPGSLDALRTGRFAAIPAAPAPWRDLLIAGTRLSVTPAQAAQPSCSN